MNYCISQNSIKDIGRIVYRSGDRSWQLFFNQYGCINVYPQQNPTMSLSGIISSSHLSQRDSIQLADQIAETTKSGKDNNALFKSISSPYYVRTNYNEGKKYCVSDTVKAWTDNQWELLDDSVTFLGLNCKQAILKKLNYSLYAIYYPNISLPFGPDRYGGLPGILLSIENSVSHKKIEAVDISYPYKNTIPVVVGSCNEGINMTLSEFTKLIKKQNQDIEKVFKLYGKKK